jgi:hypothetical protein
MSDQPVTRPHELLLVSPRLGSNPTGADDPLQVLLRSGGSSASIPNPSSRAGGDAAGYALRYGLRVRRKDLRQEKNAPEDLLAILLIQGCLYCRRYFVAPLLVNLGFCRIRFWYPVASGSGISRESSRIYFWNLTANYCSSSCDFQK